MSELDTKQPQITFYVVPHCPICENVRNQLKQKHIPYIEEDVTANYASLRKMFRISRQKLVPVISSGEKFLVRPSESELNAFLLAL